ncbi:hypothetical protein FB567DRAFT_608947 [Paraphoma chrysanthemicola]|uniref:DUF6594 domain-containing protein n=1 Tax=Paraphoma chrysanthemicola TaxID=798071 RepID=A0A8K0VTV6_9PLEO|nr:hypothetical protein FB567DRAFT_608947 [Paraphoma chrysanthemicola]
MAHIVEVANSMEKGEAGLSSTPLAPSNAPSPTASSTWSTLWSKRNDSNASKACSATSRSPKKSKAKQPKYRVPVKTRRINDHAKGYPSIAAFLDSDDGFSIYRRFGYLQSRILLQKQSELSVLEDRLQALDLDIVAEDGDAFCYQKLWCPQEEEHRQLLEVIEAKYCSYDSERRSVGRFLNNLQSLGNNEPCWIQHREDIITLQTGRNHGWLDDIVEGCLKVFHCKLIDWVFRSKETRKKTEICGDNMPAQPPKNEDKYELFYTPSRIAKLSNSILIFLVLVLLVLPIYLLYHMIHDIGTHDAYIMCIGTLLVFTLAFSSILSLFTKARRHEVLAAAAAYCAVLVVFLGNVVPSDASPSGLSAAGTTA